MVINFKSGLITSSEADKISINKIEERDTNRIGSFYYTAFGSKARYKYPERWNWLYLNNPWKVNQSPHNYIAESLDGTIVGHTGTIRVPCKIFDASTILGWSIDTIVLNEWRDKGIGKQLQQTNQEDNHCFASLSMTAVNKRIKLKIGAKPGPSSFLFTHFASFNYKKQYKRINDKLRQHMPSIFTRSFSFMLLPLAGISFVLLRYLQNMKEKALKHNLVLKEKIAGFDEESDDLWSEARERYDFAVERNKAYLNWRYKEIPWCDFYVLEVRNEKDKLLGQAVYRMEEPTVSFVGIITELIDREGDKNLMRVLALEARNQLIKKGANQIFIATSDMMQQQAIQEAGFLPIEKKTLIYHSSLNHQEINESTPALLTKGDQDWDRYATAQEMSAIRILINYIKIRKSIREV